MQDANYHAQHSPLHRLLLWMSVIALISTVLLVRQTSQYQPLDSPTPRDVASNLGNSLLSFIPNVGQTNSAVHFLAQQKDSTLFFTANEVVLSLPPRTSQSAPSQNHPELQLIPPQSGVAPSIARLRFDGANPNTTVVGANKLPGMINYFMGNKPSDWRTNVPSYAGIVYQQLYTGIDLHYTGNEDQLKGTYIIAPGADPRVIRWRYEGAEHVRLDRVTGGLLIDLPSSLGEKELQTIIERAPIAWQNINGERLPVKIHYIFNEDKSISFVTENYDVQYELTIDPILSYSTYLGGGNVNNNSDVGVSIAVDNIGSAYVTGYTYSIDFPLANPIYGTHPGNDRVAFIAKLSPDGSSLVYSTYLSGIQSGGEYGRGIAVDSEGNAYVMGITASTNFPTTPGAFQTAYGGTVDAFIAKLNATGSALLYSTYLGGSGTESAQAVNSEYGTGIALDNTNNVYITGWTTSTNFPTTPGVVQATYGGGEDDGFVVKLNATGSALAYSTYLGGNRYDEVYGIAVDNIGNSYITGYTASSDFPTTPGVFKTSASGSDAFVTKISPSGSMLVYSTFISASAYGGDIVVDSIGNTYITGMVAGEVLPATSGAFDTSFNGYRDGFMMKLNAFGSSVLYATYLGGTDSDWGYGIALDPSDNIYVTGLTPSSDFPTTPGAFQTTFSGHLLAPYIVKWTSLGNEIYSVYSTFFGWIDYDPGYGSYLSDIAVDAGGNAYIIGSSNSNTFPTTAAAFQPSFSGGTYADVFVAKLALGSVGQTTPTSSPTSTASDMTDTPISTPISTATNTSTNTPTATRINTPTNTSTPNIVPTPIPPWTLTSTIVVPTNTPPTVPTNTPLPGDALPTGNIISPIEGQKFGQSIVQFQARALDDKGVREVRFYVFYDHVWHRVGIAETSNATGVYEVGWPTPASLGPQGLTFSIHVVDTAGQVTINAGAVVKSLYAPSYTDSTVKENWVRVRYYLNQVALQPGGDPNSDHSYNMCNGASAAMVLAMNGFIQPHQMTEKAKIIWSESYDSGFFAGTIESSINRMGYGNIALALRPPGSADSAWITIKSEIDAGRALVTGTRKGTVTSGGHYIAVIGYIEKGASRQIIAYDPFGRWLGQPPDPINNYLNYDQNSENTTSQKGKWVVYDFTKVFDPSGNNLILIRKSTSSQTIQTDPDNVPDTPIYEPENLVYYPGVPGGNIESVFLPLVIR